MNKKTFFLYISIILLYLGSYAQLTVGDTMPRILFENLFNTGESQLTVPAPEKRITVLDFWETSCSGCIAAFPRLDSLQKEFDGDIQIILVNTKVSKDSIQNFFKRKNHLKVPSLPFIVQDSVLAGMFPHKLIPHHVWLDDRGIVIAITQGGGTNAENISRYLEKGEVQLHAKEDLMDFSIGEPLMANYADRLSSIHIYSCLSKGIQGIAGYQRSGKKHGSENVNSCRFNRTTPLRLLAYAHGEGGKYDFSNDSLVVWETGDSILLRPPKNLHGNGLADWWEGNGVSYELVVSPDLSPRFYTIMQEDLARYFPVRVSVEQRDVQCLVLSRLDGSKGIPAGKTRSHGIQENGYAFEGRPVDYLVRSLEGLFPQKGLTPPVVDGTGYSGDISIHGEVFDMLGEGDFTIEKLNKALLPYNLSIKLRPTPRYVLVIGGL